MSHNNTYEQRTIERTGATFQIEWQYDESPDLSYLGEYTDSPAEWTIDRKEGWLLGEYIDHEIPYSDRAVMEKKIEELEDLGMDTDWYYEDLEDGSTLYTLRYWGHEVLADNLSTWNDSRSYRYFSPANMDVEQESKEDKIKYAIRDYDRMEECNKGYWSPVGCVVTMLIDGEEVAYASLWGIESDAGEYLKEVEEDLISECIHDAKKNGAELADKLENLNEDEE